MINLTTSKVFGIHARSFMHEHIYPETMRGCGNFTHQGQWDVAVGCPIPMINVNAMLPYEENDAYHRLVAIY